MTRSRPTSVSLSAATLAIVDRHAGGSRSKVITRALQSLTRSVMAAIATLRSSDLSGDDVRAAVEALRGYWPVGPLGGSSEAVAAELGGTDAPTVLAGLREDRSDLAQSLLIAAEALDAGDAYVRDALDRI